MKRLILLIALMFLTISAFAQSVTVATTVYYVSGETAVFTLTEGNDSIYFDGDNTIIINAANMVTEIPIDDIRKILFEEIELNPVFQLEALTPDTSAYLDSDITLRFKVSNNSPVEDEISLTQTAGEIIGTFYVDDVQTTTLTLGANQSVEGYLLVSIPESGYEINETLPFTITATSEITGNSEEADFEITIINYEFLLGDANNDGIVNISDIVVVINYIMNGSASPFVFEKADVNGDGTINVLDITGIVNIIYTSKSN
ncbi:MAG: dockerin type I repeat-containing protein [Bacteroidales bacterium]|nr:dockerin type I repeat-containing protein [Bacteroidales bacterium]